MSRKNRILEYQFEDAVRLSWATAIGNAILALLLYIASAEWTVHVYYPLFTAIIFLITCLAYDWRSVLTNALLIFFYLGIAAYEFYQLGLPGSAANDTSLYENPRGVLLVFVVVAAPYLYAALRLGLVLPLILLWWRGRALG